jgi:hypothetical protein
VLLCFETPAYDCICACIAPTIVMRHKGFPLCFAIFLRTQYVWVRLVIALWLRYLLFFPFRGRRGLWHLCAEVRTVSSFMASDIDWRVFQKCLLTYCPSLCVLGMLLMKLLMLLKIWKGSYKRDKEKSKEDLIFRDIGSIIF